jgi:hypothetical protein
VGVISRVAGVSQGGADSAFRFGGGGRLVAVRAGAALGLWRGLWAVVGKGCAVSIRQVIGLSLRFGRPL